MENCVKIRSNSLIKLEKLENVGVGDLKPLQLAPTELEKLENVGKGQLKPLQLNCKWQTGGK